MVGGQFKLFSHLQQVLDRHQAIIMITIAIRTSVIITSYKNREELSISFQLKND